MRWQSQVVWDLISHYKSYLDVVGVIIVFVVCFVLPYLLHVHMYALLLSCLVLSCLFLVIIVLLSYLVLVLSCMLVLCVFLLVLA